MHVCVLTPRLYSKKETEQKLKTECFMGKIVFGHVGARPIRDCAH